MNAESLSIERLKPFPETLKNGVDTQLKKETEAFKGKIVVLDDDPTGVQTVHDVFVYTDWSLESLEAAFHSSNQMFFILTNSRSFTKEETTKVHIEIAENVDAVSKKTAISYIIISRSDSTLRGHYPLETELLKKVIEKNNHYQIDGEILCPYFFEGGRFTYQDVHYVKMENELVPSGKTEFAKDKTFGYLNSDLKLYVEEKTKGKYKAADCISIPNDLLRKADYEAVKEMIMKATDFQKVIVNATDDYDVKVFAVALYRALSCGKHFLYRTAAAFVKAMGNISGIPLLTRTQMIKDNHANGGIIVAGSHTKRTTSQLEALKELGTIEFIEMNSDLVLTEGALEREVERIVALEEQFIKESKTVCVYTKRKFLNVENDTPESALLRSVAISDALQKCVGLLKVEPAFVVAKGGITSSDVGVKALRTKRALVLGQIQPGVPVWKTDGESKFPGIPYVIFPGNVGDTDTLKKAVSILLTD